MEFILQLKRSQNILKTLLTHELVILGNLHHLQTKSCNINLVAVYQIID